VKVNLPLVGNPIQTSCRFAPLYILSFAFPLLLAVDVGSCWKPRTNLVAAFLLILMSHCFSLKYGQKNSSRVISKLYRMPFSDHLDRWTVYFCYWCTGTQLAKLLRRLLIILEWCLKFAGLHRYCSRGPFSRIPCDIPLSTTCFLPSRLERCHCVIAIQVISIATVVNGFKCICASLFLPFQFFLVRQESKGVGTNPIYVAYTCWLAKRSLGASWFVATTTMHLHKLQDEIHNLNK
jgi:hypothetical protein